jgi:hypothetical protein
VSLSGVASYSTSSGVSTSVIGGIASVTQLSVSGVSTLGVTTTTNLTAQNLNVTGDSYIVGILTANRIFSNLYGEFTGGGISGTNIVGTALSISGISTFTNGPVLVGSGTSTGTASQPLQVTGGAYVSGSIGVGTTNPAQKLEVFGEARIANRDSYFSAPGDLFSFPGLENDIKYPASSYEITEVQCVADVAGSLNNTYFTLYGPGGTSSTIDTTLTEQLVVVWFNVAGAGTTPSVVGAGRSVGIAITTGASAVSIASSIATTFSSDAAFTVGDSGIGTVYFVANTPNNFTNSNAGTSGFAVTTTSNGSGSFSGTLKWAGGVLAPNGKIYGIPYNSTSVLVIDPVVGTATTFGSLSGNAAKWIGGVLAPNGKIYGIPFDSTSILAIDPAVGTATTFGSLSGISKWYGGVLASNGKIYGIPSSSTSVLVIDPTTNTTSTFGSFSGSLKWAGGVLAPNGKIYGIPFNSTSVLVIDPVVGTATTFGSLSGNAKWYGGVLAPNGKIYCNPNISTSVLVIDPTTNTTSTFGSLSGNNKWGGGVLAPNGKIYSIPFSNTSILVIDPAVGTATTFGSLSGGFKWFGGVLAPNGKIYGIPASSTSVLSIGGGSAAIPNWYLSAYQNKF